MRQKIVHKHSYKLFDDLQLSSEDFYTSLNKSLPNISIPKSPFNGYTCKPRGGSWSAANI
jgi:hypothetical protein